MQEWWWALTDGRTDGRTDRQTDGRTDTQNFGGYNIIPRHFLMAGHNKKSLELLPPAKAKLSL